MELEAADGTWFDQNIVNNVKREKLRRQNGKE